MSFYSGGIDQSDPDERKKQTDSVLIENELTWIDYSLLLSILLLGFIIGVILVYGVAVPIEQVSEPVVSKAVA